MNNQIEYFVLLRSNINPVKQMSLTDSLEKEYM